MISQLSCVVRAAAAEGRSAQAQMLGFDNLAMGMGMLLFCMVRHQCAVQMDTTSMQSSCILCCMLLVKGSFGFSLSKASRFVMTYCGCPETAQSV